MFYSHEILSNRQYGVATIWLVATVGKGHRKLAKKAIQEVNVPKACQKILDPGAPLALRLQGSLLYGVSRVFSQQCGYVLTDAEKTQSDMMTFFRVMQTSDIDPKAGKTKRQNIVLQDDPDFDPFSALPNLDLLSWDKDLVLLPSQGSASKFSQMTPLGSVSQQSSSSSRSSALINLDLPPSSHSGASYRIPSDFCHHSPLFGKATHNLDNMPEFQPFVDDEFAPISGIGLDFDADGNLISIIDQEPELPALPDQQEAAKARDVHIIETQEGHAGRDAEPKLIFGDEDVMLDFGEVPHPNTATIFGKEIAKNRTHSQTQISETTEIEQASAKMTRTRRPKDFALLDSEIRISGHEFKGWDLNYPMNMGVSRPRNMTTSVAKARKNATTLLYDYGIADIGAHEGQLGFPHPLAVDFAGFSLKARIQGREPEEIEKPDFKKRGRRRKSDEAFEEEANAIEEQRKTRQRVDEAELGRGEDRDETSHTMFDDHSMPEVGMDAVPPMDDRHSSSMMPWSRPGSVVPGSSVRGSAQKAKAAPSPLFVHGTTVGSIDRYSDPLEPMFGRDDYGSQDSFFHLGEQIAPIDFGRENDTQTSTHGLDAASQQFLGYVQEQAVANGLERSDGPDNRGWVQFDQLADPDTHSKAVAARAFLHVLSLATQNVISVEQEGTEKKQPFGTIRIGVDVTQEKANGGAEDDDA